eukprot:COSAG06_NODE_2900_length_6114_cov_1.782024_5_plen_217_part_00
MPATLLCCLPDRGDSLLIQVGDATFLIARSSRVREVTTPSIRGRATAMFGGIGRVAQVFGPPIGGLIVARAGVGAAFVLRGVGLMLGALTVLLSKGFVGGAPPPDSPPTGFEPAPDAKQPPATGGSGVVQMVRGCVMGCVPMFTLCAMRQARSAVIPLVGAEIGLGPQQLGVLVGFASMAETALFLPAGFLYDTIGASRLLQSGNSMRLFFYRPSK